MGVEVDDQTPGITGFDWAYTYDEAGRLTVADNTDGSRDQSFSYSANGTMLSGPLGSYLYPSTGSARPHTPTSVGGNGLSAACPLARAAGPGGRQWQHAERPRPDADAACPRAAYG